MGAIIIYIHKYPCFLFCFSFFCIKRGARRCLCAKLRLGRMNRRLRNADRGATPLAIVCRRRCRQELSNAGSGLTQVAIRTHKMNPLRNADRGETSLANICRRRSRQELSNAGVGLNTGRDSHTQNEPRSQSENRKISTAQPTECRRVRVHGERLSDSY